MKKKNQDINPEPISKEIAEEVFYVPSEGRNMTRAELEELDKKII